MKEKIILASLYSYPKIGGVENSLNYMSKTLVNKGYDCRILALKNTEGVQSNGYVPIDAVDLSIGRYPFFSTVNFVGRLTSFLEKYFKDNNCDEIWCRQYLFAYCVSQTSFKGVVKFIYPTNAKLNSLGLYQEFGSERRGTKFKRSIFRKIDYKTHFYYEKKVFRNKRILNVFFSDFLKKLSEEEYGGSSHNLVISPGVDYSTYKRNPKRELSDSFRIDFKYILYVGRLAKTKNIDFLIDLAKELNQEFKILLVGKGPLEMELKDKVNLEKLNDKIFFLGSRKEADLVCLYSNANYTILPSKYESFGQVIIESFACGTPVIAFSTKDSLNASNEIVKYDFLGKVFNNYDNVTKVKEYIELEIEETESADRIMNYVREHYDWGLFTEKMLEI